MRRCPCRATGAPATRRVPSLSESIRPSKRRAHAERLKIGAGDQLTHTLIGGLAWNADRQLGKPVRSENSREYIVDVSQPFVTRIGELAWKNDQFLRTSHRQQPQHHLINEAEDRGVRSDAQREREHRYGGKARVLQQLAESEFEIIHNATPPSDRPSPRGARERSRQKAPRQQVTARPRQKPSDRSC